MSAGGAEDAGFLATGQGPPEPPVCRPRPAEDGRILIHILLALAAFAVLRYLWRRRFRRTRSASRNEAPAKTRLP